MIRLNKLTIELELNKIKNSEFETAFSCLTSLRIKRLIFKCSGEPNFSLTSYSNMGFAIPRVGSCKDITLILNSNLTTLYFLPMFQ